MTRRVKESAPELILTVASETIETINHLAEITNRKGRNRLGRVVQDALRVYSWAIKKQAQGGNIMVLTNPDMDFLTSTKHIEGKRTKLKRMFPEENAPLVARHFGKANPEKTQ